MDSDGGDVGRGGYSCLKKALIGQLVRTSVQVLIVDIFMVVFLLTYDITCFNCSGAYIIDRILLCICLFL